MAAQIAFIRMFPKCILAGTFEPAEYFGISKTARAAGGGGSLPPSQPPKWTMLDKAPQTTSLFALRGDFNRAATDNLFPGWLLSILKRRLITIIAITGKRSRGYADELIGFYISSCLSHQQEAWQG